MKRIFTKVPYFKMAEYNELCIWLSENIGQRNKDWQTYAFGMTTEISVMNDDLAAMVALRWK
jgi:hypothetical protein